MSVFSDREVAYLSEPRFARIATVGHVGMPHVVPVGFLLDAASDTIHIGSRMDLSATKKFRDAARHPKVAIVIDDMASFDPPSRRGIEVRGRAEALTEGGERIGEGLGMCPFDPAWIRIRPTRIASWGIDGEPFGLRTPVT